jgi:hypothetical protein
MKLAKRDVAISSGGEVAEKIERCVALSKKGELQYTVLCTKVGNSKRTTILEMRCPFPYLDFIN